MDITTDDCMISFNKLMSAKGSTFKEYTVDEFLRTLEFTLNLFENGKYCSKCKKMKNIEEFGRNKNWCKECKNTAFKEYYSKNKEKMKENMKNDYEKRKQLITCTCGVDIFSVCYKTHLKSKNHYNCLIEKNTL
jgi:hypothetical protein